MPKTTKPKRTWQYGKEFKITAVKLSYKDEDIIDTHNKILIKDELFIHNISLYYLMSDLSYF
ncbi:MAG: hypothetical protein OQL19_17940 [Gammaproteobacteria bacterium]|nr:hypothetical protein [Gammaproteobacteria bacterium]